MKFHYLIFFIFFIVSIIGLSQNSELGIVGGSAYYVGEINPTIPIINKVNPTLGLFYKKNLNKRYALRYGLNYAKLSATDKFRTTDLANYRELSFSTDLWEGYGLLEFNFIPYQINNLRTSNFSPYVFIGLAVFYVNPKTIGAPSEGSNIALSIPFGVGLKFNFAKNIGLGIEWGLRKTYTDKIDGLPKAYSKNGYQLSNTQNNDWYSMIGITINYKILTDKDHCNMPGI